MRHDLDTLLVIDLETPRYSTQEKVDLPTILESFFAGLRLLPASSLGDIRAACQVRVDEAP